MTPTPKARTIRTRAGSAEARQLLQTIFAAELIRPSKILWIVSAWLTNVPLLDNRTLSFSSVNPAWGAGYIRLIEILKHLLERGASIHLAIAEGRDQQEFVTQLMQRIPRAERKRLIIHQDVDDLHAKELVGDHFHLMGSMNLTWNGVNKNEETLQLIIDPAQVEQARVHFLNRWGGAAPAEENPPE